MDRLVTVSRTFLNRVRGFLNIFAVNCKGCLHKAQVGCFGCDCFRARELIAEIDTLRISEEEQYFVENPNKEIESRIIKAIRQAGHPLPSREINIKDISRARKNWIITSMVNRGLIFKTRNQGKYLYSINENKQ